MPPIKNRNAKTLPTVKEPTFDKKEYVCGFIFSPEFDEVVLIRKLRPEWQKGYLNGIGGRVEVTDTGCKAAMVRECREETGLTIKEMDWTQTATLNHIFPVSESKLIANYMMVVVHFYYARSDNYDKATTIEDEQVVIVPTHIIQTYKTIPNLKWLIPLCINWNVHINGDVYTEPVTFIERNSI